MGISELTASSPARNPVVTVFGSGILEEPDAAYQEARTIGRMLAEGGCTICNGGYGGLMAATARGAKEMGGRTIGITLRAIPAAPNRWIDREISTGSLTERLMELVSTGDGFVILRGGTGTLLELAAVWELMNKEFQPRKPVVAVGDFWSPVIGLMARQLTAEGRTGAARYVVSVSSAREAAEFMIGALRGHYPAGSA